MPKLFTGVQGISQTPGLTSCYFSLGLPVRLNVYKGSLGTRKQGALLAGTSTPSLPPAATAYALVVRTRAE